MPAGDQRVEGRGRAPRPPTPRGCPPRPPPAAGPGCVRPPGARRAPPTDRAMSSSPSRSPGSVACPRRCRSRRRGRRRRPGAGRRCGPAPLRPRARGSSSSCGSSACRTRLRAKAGSALCGSSHGSRPCAWQPPVRRPGRGRERPTHAAADRGHPREGPRTGAARQPQQHRLGLVVAGVAQQDDGGAEPVRRLVEGGVPSAARGILGSPARPDGHGGDLDGVEPEIAQGPGHGRGAVRRTRPGARGRRSPHRRARRCAAASWTVAAASTRESAPPAAGDEHEVAGSTSASASRTARRVSATGAGGPLMPPGAARATQAAGSASSAGVGSAEGADQTALKPVIPTSSTTPRTKAAPSLYWRSLASMPSSLRRAASPREGCVGGAGTAGGCAPPTAPPRDRLRP